MEETPPSEATVGGRSIDAAVADNTAMCFNVSFCYAPFISSIVTKPLVVKSRLLAQ